MKLVIDIPKELYEEIIHDEACGLNELTRAVANGIPLPEHHGRLIDADVACPNHTECVMCPIAEECPVCAAPTIIPATKEGESE